MKNADYWRERFSILEDAARRNADQCIRGIEEMFREAEYTIRADIERWYGRFAQNNQITLADARKMLTSGQLEEFKWTVEQYIQAGKQADLSPEWIRKLENASARFHISRLESIQLQIQQQLELLYGNQLDSIDDLLKKIVSNGYTKSAFEIQKGLGLGWDITAINPKRLETLLSRPWTADKRTFRDRCWEGKANLVSGVEKSLTQGLLRGDSHQKITAAISKQFGVSRYKAGRLVHTETTYFNAISHLETYRELEVERVEIIETLDSHTCGICGPLDGMVIPIVQYEPGVTVPPFHPNCVLPDTVIASPDGEAIMKSEYSGEVIQFTTANGRRLSITPNHIMLTTRGWVRAKNLIQSDQVIYYHGWDEFIVEANPTHNDSIPTVEQLFASLLKSCAVPSISVPASAEDLKGDVVKDSKIDIVLINGFLRDVLNSSAGKFFSDLPLVRATKLGEAVLSGKCSLAQFLMGIGFASDGIMGGLNIAGILLDGSLTHHELISLRRGTHYNTRLQQTAFNNCLGNRKPFSDGIDAFAGSIEGDNFINGQILSGVGLPDINTSPGKNSIDGFSSTAKEISDFCNAFPGVVEFDNVVRVDRRFYTGHVYDISSLSTLYLCNGFLSSNCRGTTAPAIEDEDAVGKRAARDQDGNVYYVPADMTYEEWWEKYVDNSRENVIMKLAKAHSISGILDTTPRIIDTTDYTFDEAHINRKRKHNVTREEAEQFIRDAEVSFTRWKGQFVCYIGSKGSTYIDVKNKNIRTSFKRNEYDENIMNFIKGVEKLNG